MKKNNLKKINLQKIKKKLGNIFSSIGSKFKKIKPVEFGVGAVVIVLSCVVIVPSLVQCVINRNKAKCSTHMSIMLNMLSDDRRNILARPYPKRKLSKIDFKP